MIKRKVPSKAIEDERVVSKVEKSFHHKEPFVYVERSATIKVDEFTFTKVTVGVSVPVDADERFIKNAMATTDKLDIEVENYLMDRVDEILEDLN